MTAATNQSTSLSWTDVHGFWCIYTPPSAWTIQLYVEWAEKDDDGNVLFSWTPLNKDFMKNKSVVNLLRKFKAGVEAEAEDSNSYEATWEFQEGEQERWEVIVRE